MIQSFIIFFENILIPLGGWGVFGATLIEQIIAPIPSAVVQLSAGFFLINTEYLGKAFFDILATIAIPSAVAVGIGSFLVYWIAYYLGKKFVDVWGGWLGVNWESVEKLHEKFNHSGRDNWILFVLRALPAVPTVAVDIFCGIVRFDLKRYIIITFFGTLVRAFLFGVIGWQVGSVYVRYANIISRIEGYVLVGLVVVTAVVLFSLWYKKKHK